MGTCSVDAHVKNQNDEVVTSKLWKDANRFTEDRGEAKQYYAVGTNEQFVDSVRDQADFDENGQITFESVERLSGLNLSQQKILKTLNRDVNAGKYAFNEAMPRLQQFNRESQYNKRYMATVTQDKGEYQLQVVERTPQNEIALENTIKNRNLQDTLIDRLKELGVAVDFLQEGDRYGGRYSTENAEKTADGLYHLVKVVRGEKIEENLAEEAGHFAIGALGKSPLVQRLMELLTPEIQRQLLGDEYESKNLGMNPKREVAGTLVGKYIMDNHYSFPVVGKMLGRIMNLAKRVFGKLTGNEIMRDVANAREYARQIAEGFMSPRFKGSVENALDIKETLFSAPLSPKRGIFRDIAQRLALNSEQMKAIADDRLSHVFGNMYKSVVSGRLSRMGTPALFGDTIALSGIAEALDLFNDMIGQGKEINRLLESINFDSDVDFYMNMPENGRKLRQVRTFLNNSYALQDIINRGLPTLGANNVLQYTHNGQVISVPLQQVLWDLTDANGRLMQDLTAKEFQFFAKFCENTLGKTHVDLGARAIFGKKGISLIDFVDGKISVQEALTELEGDISFFERFIASMSNNSDIIGQICDKVTKRANKMADDQTNQVQDDLRILKERLTKIGLKNTDILFERSAVTGGLTGNIISPYNWGDYETAYEQFRKDEWEKFKNATPNFDTLTEVEKSALWHVWIDPKVKQWHANNSVFDSLSSTWMPNDSYKNPEYRNIMDRYKGNNNDLEKWLNDYMALKADLDSRLPEGSTLHVRAPQFKGTYINKVQNRMLFDGVGVRKAAGSAWWKQAKETFMLSSEDQDFGSLQTYNSEEEALLYNSLAMEKEKINRLPLFGINKLKGDNMQDLSTDLFHSTLAYASMANQYEALSQIVDVMEVGAEVLNRRKVAGIQGEQEKRSNKSRAYTRYIKFLDKQVYGIGQPKIQFGKIVWNKIANGLSSFASKYFLGFNVAGGIVNTGTGTIEIFKEAMTGEYYGIKDWKKAHQMYFGSFIQNWLDYGSNYADNKTTLFIRHFNMLGDNKSNYREWTTRHSRAFNALSRSLYLPYKSGDHYMQCMSYLALANGIKLYDENGNKISLFNAYEIVDNEDQYGNKQGKTLKMKDGLFFKDENGKQEYDMITSIIDEVEDAHQNRSLNHLNFTQEQLQYLQDNGYNMSTPEEIQNSMFQMENKKSSLVWNDDAESEFMDKAREINNRLHGIYNNQDKTAFHQSWYGNAVLAMRGWALGMAERRFARNHYNLALGRSVEGSITTMSKLAALGFQNQRNQIHSFTDFLTKGLSNLFTDEKGFGLTMRALFLPFTKSTRQAMLNAGFSENQYRNVRRNAMDYMFILGLTLIKAATAAGVGGAVGGAQGSKDDDQIAGLIYYFTNRWLREQAALNTPTGAWTESNTLLDIQPAGFAALGDLGKLFYEFAGAQFADPEDSDFFYKQNKEGRYQKGDPKYLNHFIRISPIRSEYTFEYPYEASKSFEYGRNIKGR